MASNLVVLILLIGNVFHTPVVCLNCQQLVEKLKEAEKKLDSLLNKSTPATSIFPATETPLVTLVTLLPPVTQLTQVPLITSVTLLPPVTQVPLITPVTLLPPVTKVPLITPVTSPSPVNRKIIPFDVNPGSFSATVIPNIHGAFGTITHGNEIFVTGYYDQHLHHIGPGGLLKEKIKVPFRNPTFMDIYNGLMYIGSLEDAVYTRPLDGSQGFSELLRQHQPVGVKVAPGGKKIYVSEWNTGKINIYDHSSPVVKKIRTTTGVDLHPRKICFDPEGNILVSALSNTIYVFNKDLQLIRKEVIMDAEKIDGFYVHSDGSRVLVDQTGKLIFTYKHGEIIHISTGFRSPTDVALTRDGILSVTDFGANKVYLFPVY